MKNSVLVAVIVVLLIPLVALAIIKGRDESGQTDLYYSTSSTPTSVSSTPKQQNVSSASQLQEPADAVKPAKVVLKTTKGDIALNLYVDDSPKTVANFATLGKRGYYNGIIFHRVIRGFMIQGGDPTGSGSGGESIYGTKFPDEFNGHKIVKGTLAMANAGANTNGSQFFIVTDSAQPHLDGKHTAFGEVADEASMGVVQAIAAVPVDGNDRPREEVRITGFEIP